MTSVAEKLQRKAPRKVSSKQVRLRLVYLDFWSVVKLSFLLSICLGIVQVVLAVGIWVVLNSTQVFDRINQTASDIIGSPFDITDQFSLTQVTLFAVIVAVLNIVIGTALGAIFSLLYNFAARITGGLLVGFKNS